MYFFTFLNIKVLFRAGAELLFQLFRMYINLDAFKVEGGEFIAKHS